ncbi:MAG: hypothetical protein Phog2KO_50410 [Phototrophicaceae bacterium]
MRTVCVPSACERVTPQDPVELDKGSRRRGRQSRRRAISSPLLQIRLHSPVALTDDEIKDRYQQLLQGDQIAGMGLNEFGLVIYKAPDELMKLWVPQELKRKILAEEHDHQIAGHLGMDRTYDLVTRKYYWP